MLHQSDEKLLAAFCNGQESALDQLLTRYQDRVLRFVQWRTGLQQAEAEDIAQDVFLQVFRSAQSFAGHSSFKTWLYGVANNTCRHALRTRSRQAAALVCDAEAMVAVLPDHGPGALDSMLAKESRQELHAAVMALDFQQRTVLLLRERENLTYAEIAEVVGIPLGTVKSRVYHARLQLGRLLVPGRAEKVKP